MGDLPPTKKKIGLLMGHLIDFNDQGQATHERAFLDSATMMSQLGVSKMPARKAMTKGWAKTTEVVIAKNDDGEKANVAVAQAMVDAFNKHDAKAFGDTLDKKVVWSDQGEPKDLDQKGAVKDSQGFWKGFSDVKITPDETWGAGPYVVITGTIAGTNDGDVPAMKLKKTGKAFTSPFLHIIKVENGKVTGSWIFYDGMGMAGQLGMLPPPPAAKK
jgi:predicted ester cyclase